MTVKDYIKKNANLPNLLTMIRILLIPVYLLLFARGQKYLALVVFLVACFTDLLDGYLARRLNSVTDFGKLMDPFADKVMVLTAMFSMAIGNAFIPPVIPWSAVVILLMKEGIMIVGGLIMLRHGIVVYASMIGKVAHVVFICALVASFFHDSLVSLVPAGILSPDLWILWLAVVLTLCALVFYVKDSIRKGIDKGIIGDNNEKR